MGYKPDQYKLSKKNPRDKLREGGDLDFGIYMAEVIVRPKDETHTGRIPVYIPMLSKDRDDPSGYYNAYWSSPFAGSTPSSKLGPNTALYADAQKSYGLWMVPPDPGNFVLVAFADGKKKFPVIVSCLYPDQLQFMVPGNAATSIASADAIAAPVAELNKRQDSPNHAFLSRRPFNPYATLPLCNQGLLLDNVRGTTTSSARRESPSEVFGILTPGPDDVNNNGELNGTNRMAGHSFVLDDSLDHRHVRLRTAGGAQLLLDDTNEVIYIGNQKGTAWAEFDSDGNVVFYADDGFTVRSRNDLNLHSDSNVNIHAGRAVNINAGLPDQDPGPRQNPDQPTGTGMIHMQASFGIRNITRAGGYYTQVNEGGGHSVVAAGTVFVTSNEGSIHHQSAEGHFIQGGAGIDIKAGGEINAQAGGRFNALGSTVHLNDGGSASDAVPGQQVTYLDMYAYDEPVEEAIQMEYDANAHSDTNLIFPDNGYRPGGNNGIKADPVQSICSELTTREPWYSHKADMSGTKVSTALKEEELAQLADRRPGTVGYSNTAPPQQTAGRPGDDTPGSIKVQDETQAWQRPDGVTLPLQDVNGNYMPKSALIPGTKPLFRDAVALNSRIGQDPGLVTPNPGGEFSTPLKAAENLAAHGNDVILDKTVDWCMVLHTNNTTLKNSLRPISRPQRGADGWEQTYVVGYDKVVEKIEIDRGHIITGINVEPKAGLRRSIVVNPTANQMIGTSGISLNQLSQEMNPENNYGKELLTQLQNDGKIRATTAGPWETATGWTIDILAPDGTLPPPDERQTFQVHKIGTTVTMDRNRAKIIEAANMTNTRLFVAESLRQGPGLSAGQFAALTSFAHSVGKNTWMQSGVRDAVLQSDFSAIPDEMFRHIGLRTSRVNSQVGWQREFQILLFFMPTTYILAGNDLPSNIKTWIQVVDRYKHRHQLIADNVGWNYAIFQGGRFAAGSGF